MPENPQESDLSGQVEPSSPAGDDALRAQVRLGEIGLSGFAPYLLSRVVGSYNAVLRRRLDKYGLTMPKIRTLAVLSVIEGPLIRDLAVYTMTEQSTLSRALDGLESAGMVRRNQDPQDSRGIRVCLTELGRETFEQLWPQMAGIYADMFAGIPEDERRALVAVLQKLMTNIDNISG